MDDPPADPEAVARSIVLRRLTLAPRTRNELTKTLDDRLVPADVRDRVLDRFTAVGLIDDEALAASFADSRRTRRGWSRRDIERKLRERGVAPDTVRQALDTVTGEQELHTATELVRSRWQRMASLDPAVRRRRLLAMLARRGYPMSVATTALQAVAAPSPEESLL
jgi:regulatory protein